MLEQSQSSTLQLNSKTYQLNTSAQIKDNIHILKELKNFWSQKVADTQVHTVN